MKTIHRIVQGLALLALATLNLQPSTCFAQGTAFTYQGRLGSGGTAATGLFDFNFALYNAASGGIQQGVTFTTNAVPVTNGYFMVALDFGGVFDGSARWLDIAVKTNAASSYSPLAPRQLLTPAPYAIMANSASNLLGTLPSTQLTGTIPASQLSGTFTGNVIGSATSATTATTANNFSGSLAGDVTGTQGATAVSTVGGSTAVNIHAAEQLANAATSAATASTIVKRDGSGNFTSTSITLNGNLNLPATTASAGVIYSGGSPFIHAYGSQNFFAGAGAGNLTMTGTGDNTGVGAGALQNNTSGYNNTANGFQALYSNTNGVNNTANGESALRNNTSGYDNAANGRQALLMNTVGVYDTANGAYALVSNTNGSFNTANGGFALWLNTSGSYNTADGMDALEHNTSGSYNIALGYNAGYNLTAGSNNIDIGNLGVSTDDHITRIGDVQTQTFIAGVINGNGGGLTNLNAANVSGTFTGNVVGSATSATTAGSATTATTANNFSGSLAGDVTGTQGATVVSTVGGQSAANVASGASAANAATSAATASTIVKRDGSGNFTSTSITLNGNLNLPATTASAGIIYSGGSTLIHSYGNYNFFAGSYAGNMTMTGPGDNTGIGYLALFSNTTGSNNVANGATSLSWNSTGNNNTANGYGALLKNTSGSYNTANGFNALFWNISGNFNTGDGQQALVLNNTGTNNIAVGYQAGYNIQNNNNIDIGNPGVSSDNNIIRIGSGQTSTYLAGNSVHVPGMLRLGSETNTASGPNYPSDGLVIRRISSTAQTVSNLLARTDMLMLTRDGTAAGLAINYSIVGGYNQNIVAIGIDNAGVQHLYKNTLTAGSGTLFIFNNTLRIVHYDVSFGNVYNGGHTCHVILDRYDDGSTSDNYMIGYLTSTYNQ